MKYEFLEKILQERAIVVCCGSGGVGKTTTSAVLALHAARMGRKTLVLTIDPAKRLANALGLPEIGNTVTPLPKDHLIRAGIDVTADISAMMLDCKRTFDDLVLQYAPDRDMADAILRNVFYQHISNAMTGSHEYMAMEKLYEIHEKGEYDMVVLDTPPTQHALDFLEAPDRMSKVLDDSALKWFLKPYFVAGKFSFKAAQRGSNVVFKILERVTGVQVLQDISEFLLSFSGMYEGFKLRAEKVRDLLRHPQTAFCVVTSPNQVTLDEAAEFCRKLREKGMPFGGGIANRVRRSFLKDDATISASQEASSPLHEKLWTNLRQMQQLHEADEKALATFLEDSAIAPSKMARVPQFDEDIADLVQLRKLLDVLFESPQESAGASGRVRKSAGS